MPDTSTGADGAQAAPDTQPPAGDSSAQAADGDGESSSQPESMSLEEAKKLRSEHNALRKRIKAFEDAEAKRADADKTAEERAAGRITDLEKELESERSARRSVMLQIAASSAARKLNFRDPELASRLVGSAEVEYADDGSPKNVEKLLGDLAREHPVLVNATADFGGGPRGTAPAGEGDMNAYIRARTGRH